MKTLPGAPWCIDQIFPIPWWRHQMETFSALLALCALLTLCTGNSLVTGEFPHKGQWRWALMFSLICTWTNGWVNNQDASDLRCHRTYYDVTVMTAPLHGEGTWGGGYCIISYLSSFFSVTQNIAYLLNITFIFVRYHCSLAAVIPAKCECDSSTCTCKFAK